MRLVILDENGKEDSVKPGDAGFTSAVEIPNGNILVAGTRGHLYQINPEKRDIVKDQEISSSTLTIEASQAGSLILAEGLMSLSKIHFIEENFKVNTKASIDIEKALGKKSGMTAGPFKVHSFENGALALLNGSAGKILFISKDRVARAFDAAPVSYKTSFNGFYNLTSLDPNTAFVISNDFTIHKITSDGNFSQFKSDLENLNANELKQDEEKLVIQNANAGCIASYTEWMKENSKNKMMVNGLLGLTTILNPVVGIAGIVMTHSDVMTNWSASDHISLVIKVLDDAESNKVSTEIQMIGQALMQFDQTKFPNIEAVMAALREMNQSKLACEINGGFASATLRDLMYRLILDYKPSL